MLADVGAAGSDVLRYGLSNARIKAGTIPLNQAIALFAGARRSLLAAACSVVQPKRVHKRMALSDAEAFVNACRVGQTEEGSFVARFLCPLTSGIRSADEAPTLVPIQKRPAFSRQVTATLMRSLNFIVDSIRSDTPERITSPDAGDPVVSANLCEALTEIQTAADEAELTVSARWALGAASPDVTPSRVRLPHEYVPTLEAVAKQLRSQAEPKPDTFVALADELRGEVGEDGRRQGEVVLSVFLEDEAVTAKAMLSADQYAIAYRAHDHSKYNYVGVAGVLHRGRRLSTLADVSTFRLLDLPSATAAG